MQEAVRDGRLPERRLLNYKKLLAEAAHAKRREETARKKQLRSVERKKNPVRKSSTKPNERGGRVYREKNVIECNCVTGDYSMLLEVLFENTMELDRFIGELQYFGRTKTLIVFSTSVEHRGVEL